MRPAQASRPTPRGRVTISLRTALFLFIMVTVVSSGLLLHLTWWRTATGVSRDLVDALAYQVTDAVRRAWWGRVLEVQGLVRTLAESLSDAPEDDRALAAAAASSPALSWLVHVPAGSGPFVAVSDETPGRLVLLRADRTGRVVEALGVRREPLGLMPDTSAHGPLIALGEGWTVEAGSLEEAGWLAVARTPSGREPAVAFVDSSRGALLAGLIGYSRFAQILGDIPVARSGRSYVLGPDGRIVIASDAAKAPRRPDLDAVALAAGRGVAARPPDGLNVTEKTRLSVDGQRYAVGLSPLWFQGWQLAVIVPEADFLAEIDATIGRVALGLAAFVALAGALGAAIARAFVAAPIARVARDLAHVERFELERVPRRLSRLSEIDRLSAALVRMSAGLADFAKYIPTDLVRSLVAEGMRAEPGGSRREITVLFADLAGFTTLAERLGDDVVPVVSRYLDAASRAIAAEGGTVDKFIGDAVMAFWNAPGSDPDHALHACRAALAIARAVEGLDLPPGVVSALRVRVGVQTGPAIVGNVGSASRLNYTALGDTVNQASRLEGANKVYGTTILVGAATQAAAGAAVVTRTVDRVAVYGRSGVVVLHELLGIGPDERPAWIGFYESALAAYQDRRFEEAISHLSRVIALRPADGPAARLMAFCRKLAAEPPSPDWSSVTSLGEK